MHLLLLFSLSAVSSSSWRNGLQQTLSYPLIGAPQTRYNSDVGRAGALMAPARRHDVTPWTHHNRVPLCQATLSIGPYLLLKGTVPTPYLYPRVLAYKP